MAHGSPPAGKQYFPGQRDDETVHVLTRPHWLVLLREFVVGFVGLLLPITILVALSAGGSEPFGPDARPFTVVILPAFYLSLVTYLFIRWVDYYLDVGIVTNQRVIDIDQIGLFRRNVDELDLAAVQDVTAHKTGLLQTFFDFGDVNIQTAGEKPNFVFDAIPHADRCATKIGELHNKVGEKEDDETAESIKEAAEAMKEVAEHMDQTEGSSDDKPAAPGPIPQPQRPPANATQSGSGEDSEDKKLPREYEG